MGELEKKLAVPVVAYIEELDDSSVQQALKVDGIKEGARSNEGHVVLRGAPSDVPNSQGRPVTLALCLGKGENGAVCAVQIHV